MWIVTFDSHVMTVISTDFVPIIPYNTTQLNIAIGQRYDVIVDANQAVGSYFVRAIAQTGCPSGSANNGLGTSNGVIRYVGADDSAPTSTTPITSSNAAICNDEPITSLVPYLQKSAGSSSLFTSSAAQLPAGLVNTVQTSDDGTVFRWYLNNGAIDVDFDQPTLKTLATTGTVNSTLISNPIVLNGTNQWVYFVIQNQFFASHPLHFHGHDVSLLGQFAGSFNASQTSLLNFVNPPRRDTVMLAGSAGPGNPAGTTVIGFQTDNPGAWLMHCHIVWHVEGGLALQFIERPGDIPASSYVNKPAFQDECSSLAAYEAAVPDSVKTDGESGLKRRAPGINWSSPVKKHLESHHRHGARAHHS